MSNEWPLTTLAQQITIKHGLAFRGEYFSVNPSTNVLVTPGNFRIGGGFKADKLKYYDGPVTDEYVLKPGSLVVTMTDLSKDMDTLGFPAWVPDLQGRLLLHNQRIGLVEPLNDGVNLEYLYYVMCSWGYRSEVLASSTGTTVHHTSPSRILAYRFPLPSTAEQQAIAEVLSSLDLKIESDLRAIAAILKLCIVRFRCETTVNVPMNSVATVTMGSSPPGTSYTTTATGLPFYQGTRDFGLYSPSNRVWTTAPIRLAAPGDTLLSVRAPVGELNRADERCCIGRGLAALSSEFPSTMYCSLASSPHLWRTYQQDGTVFGAINKTDLNDLQVPWPDSKRVLALEKELSELDRKALQLQREVAALRSLRDTLMPQLLDKGVQVLGGSAGGAA